MKFDNIIEGLLTEAQISKKYLEKIKELWSQDAGDISDEQYTKIINGFKSRQNNLEVNSPPVYSFLHKYDGRHNPKFEEKNIRDLEKYSYPQILYLLNGLQVNGFKKSDLVTFTENLQHLKFKPETTSENIEANVKKSFDEFWNGNKYKILDNNGVRVYEVNSVLVSRAFGYFQNAMVKEVHSGNPWCVVSPTSDHYYCSYRGSTSDSPRTFYFIIDENRDRHDNHYINVLNVYENGKFFITPLRNEGDYDSKRYGWDKVIQTFPELAGSQELFTHKVYDSEAERPKADEETHRIVDDPRSRHSFIDASFEEKIEYLTSDNGFIKYSETWESLTPEMENLYVRSIRGNNITNKIPNLDIFFKIRAKDSLYKSLLYVLGFNENDVSDSYREFIKGLVKTSYVLIEQNFVNVAIYLVQSKTSRHYGIFDSRNMEWFKNGGTIYDDVYTMESTRRTYHDDSDDNEWSATPFEPSRGGRIPFIRLNSQEFEPKKCYLLSVDDWENLKTRMRDVGELTNNDFENIKNTTDIKETN